MGVSAIILAGGLSRRFGTTNKLLTELDGATILEMAISRALAVKPDEVVVVTGFDSKRVEEAVREAHTGNSHLRCVFNSHFRTGLASSIVCGSLAARPGNSVLVWPADKPLIRSDTVERLLDFASGNRIVVPVFRRRQGHPVHFGESFRRELAQLEGDFGARAILDRHPEAVTEVEVDDQGVIVDVDTEADLTSVAMLTDERK